jgi:hypothetical protein
LFNIEPRDRFAWSDQALLFQCEAKSQWSLPFHDRLRAFELDVTLSDFVGKGVVAGAQYRETQLGFSQCAEDLSESAAGNIELYPFIGPPITKLSRK